MFMKTKTNEPNYPLFIVVWQDHTGDSSWVKLCNTYTSDGGWGGLDLILRSCITEMYELDIQD